MIWENKLFKDGMEHRTVIAVSLAKQRAMEVMMIYTCRFSGL